MTEITLTEDGAFINSAPHVDYPRQCLAIDTVHETQFHLVLDDEIYLIDLPCLVNGITINTETVLRSLLLPE